MNHKTEHNHKVDERRGPQASYFLSKINTLFLGSRRRGPVAPATDTLNPGACGSSFPFQEGIGTPGGVTKLGPFESIPSPGRPGAGRRTRFRLCLAVMRFHAEMNLGTHMSTPAPISLMRSLPRKERDRTVMGYAVPTRSKTPRIPLTRSGPGCDVVKGTSKGQRSPTSLARFLARFPTTDLRSMSVDKGESAVERTMKEHPGTTPQAALTAPSKPELVNSTTRKFDLSRPDRILAQTVRHQVTNCFSVFKPLPESDSYRSCDGKTITAAVLSPLFATLTMQAPVPTLLQSALVGQGRSGIPLDLESPVTYSSSCWGFWDAIHSDATDTSPTKSSNPLLITTSALLLDFPLVHRRKSESIGTSYPTVHSRSVKPKTPTTRAAKSLAKVLCRSITRALVEGQLLPALGGLRRTWLTKPPGFVDPQLLHLAEWKELGRGSPLNWNAPARVRYFTCAKTAKRVS